MENASRVNGHHGNYEAVMVLLEPLPPSPFPFFSNADMDGTSLPFSIRFLNYKPQPVPRPLASSSIVDVNPRNYEQPTIRWFRNFVKNDGNWEHN
jgi:hypothetical protein